MQKICCTCRQDMKLCNVLLFCLVSIYCIHINDVENERKKKRKNKERKTKERRKKEEKRTKESLMYALIMK